ncbi:MAG: AAA family ATPase, partial [Victivallales bacterium]|nr:AAA family ATPase [Victivallales bacterium]
MAKKLPPNNPPSSAKQQGKATEKHVVNMKRDLRGLIPDALGFVQALKSPSMTLEHLLLAILRTDKFRPYLETLFARHQRRRLEVTQRLMGELLGNGDGVTGASMSGDDDLSSRISQDILMTMAKLEVLAERQSGYCLPPLCLHYLLTERQDSPATALLRGYGLTDAELQSDTAKMAKENPEDLPDSPQCHSSPDAATPPDPPEEQSLEERLNSFAVSANAMKQDLFLLAKISSRISMRMQHAYLLPEHLLLAFLKAEKFSVYTTDVFERRHQIPRKDIEEQVCRYLNANIEKLKKGCSPEITPAYGRVITNVIRQLKSTQANCFSPMFLLGLLQEDCFATMLIRQVLFDPRELQQDVQLMATAGDQAFAPSADPPSPSRQDAAGKPEDLMASPGQDDDELQKPLAFESDDDFPWDENPAEADSGSALETFSVELVEQARLGRIDPLIGRQEEVARLIEILHKKRSCNALIVGNEGVGKTAIVEGLALRIAKGKVPASIRDYKIFALNLGAMVAGSELRGTFERRLEQCIKELTAQPKCFLFIDEIHSMLGAGTGHDGTLDASNIIKPYLARGEVRCIGATTYDEYQRRILNDRAFARRFMKIDLAESTGEETLQILRGLAKSYEQFHGVKLPLPILRHIVDLSKRFVHEKYFPDKAIEVMDECGARYHCGLAKGTAVTKADVERVVCRVAHLPAITVHSDESDKLLHLEDNLKKSIFGQDEAVAELVRHVKVAKAGFQDPRKPLLSAFLCGPSGCGKTELARQLAAELGIAFVKLDMSEYSEEYAASRLVGSAPGYVGYDRPGALTEPVIQTPHCLLLLDEIEKAHAVVFNLLLQVLDEGRLRDNKGREASF